MAARNDAFYSKAPLGSLESFASIESMTFSPLIQALDRLDAMTMIVALASLKGGSGRSATAGMLAWSWSQAGKRVAVVDLDGASLTASRWLGTPSSGKELGQALVQGKPLGRLLVQSVLPGVQLLPAGPELLTEEPAMERPLGLEKCRRALVSLQDSELDLVVLDCPPRSSALVMAACAVSGVVVLPVPLQPAACATLPDGLAMLAEIKDTVAPGLRVLVLATFSDRRTGVSADALATLKKGLGDGLLRTIVPVGSALARAMGRKGTMPHPRTPVAEAYRALAAEVLRRVQ